MEKWPKIGGILRKLKRFWMKYYWPRAAPWCTFGTRGYHIVGTRPYGPGRGPEGAPTIFPGVHTLGGGHSSGGGDLLPSEGIDPPSRLHQHSKSLARDLDQTKNTFCGVLLR